MCDLEAIGESKYETRFLSESQTNPAFELLSESHEAEVELVTVGLRKLNS